MHMKRIFAGTLLYSLIIASACAQYGQALKRAHQVVDENNVRQGVPSPAQTQPAPPRPAIVNSNTVTQAQSWAALQGDLAGFKTGAVVTEAQKRQFTTNLTKAARGNKPTSGAIKKFGDSLTEALSGASLTEEQRRRLAQNIDAILNSRGMAATQFDKIIADTDAILRVGSVKFLTATSVAADLKAIGAEVRK